jgi:serine protease Do
MRDHSFKAPRRPVLLSGLLLAAGVLIGIVISSEIGWLPRGHAVPDPDRSAAREAVPVTAAMTPGMVAAAAAGERNFVLIAKTVTPAVVNIFTSRNGTTELPRAMPFDDPFFRRFFGDDFLRRFETPRERKERSLGSGVIVQASGLIITNNHVVNGADEIKVYLSDKREFRAKLIGTDTKTDLALLRVEADGLQTVPWADSDRLEVGEFVLAVGNPFGLNQTVTMGIVSAVGRASMGIAEYEDFIQTDAAINPGNSGGALVNARGELVGINTAIFSQSGGNMGIGFAVPSNMARSIVEQLVRSGKVVRGWLGVSIQELTPDLAKQFTMTERQGVLVSDVLDDSPAKRAGLERGDVIVEFDGRTVESPTQLRNAVARTGVGTTVTVKFFREKHLRSAEVPIAEQPTTVAQASTEEIPSAAAPASLLSDIEVRDLNTETATRLGLRRSERGVAVVRVQIGSVAEEAGLSEGDVILEVNRTAIADHRAYDRVAARVGRDDAVLLLIKRQGRTSYVTLKP